VNAISTTLARAVMIVARADMIVARADKYKRLRAMNVTHWPYSCLFVTRTLRLFQIQVPSRDDRRAFSRFKSGRATIVTPPSETTPFLT